MSNLPSTFQTLRNTSSGIIVPYGTIDRLRTFASYVRPKELSPNIPVLKGEFPSAGFESNKDLPIFCDVRLIEIAPFCLPAMVFILQVGPAIAHWFADMSDDTMWDLLEEWNSYGTMALAAKLDDGRVLFGVKSYSIDQEFLRCLRADTSRHREDIKAEFPRTMATIQALDGIKGIAISSLPEYPVVETAYINTVRTARTKQVVVPIDDLPLMRCYLSREFGALSPELDALRQAGFRLATRDGTVDETASLSLLNCRSLLAERCASSS